MAAFNVDRLDGICRSLDERMHTHTKHTYIHICELYIVVSHVYKREKKKSTMKIWIAHHQECESL